MSEQEKTDQALAERLIEIAAEMMAKGSEATVGLNSLLTEIHHSNPRALEAFQARVTLARLGLKSSATAH